MTDEKRVLEVPNVDNLVGGTKRVYTVNSIDNTRGGTKRVIVVGGGGGNIDELNVTPSTSAQTITASGGVDGYSPVNVSAVDASIDANITAANIKKDVSILGITGTYEGQTPTGSISITSNGTYDVTDKAEAVVNVPTTAPARYLEYEVDSSGQLKHSVTASNLINLNGVTQISEYALYRSYYENQALSGIIDMSNIETIFNSGCYQMFQYCTGITGANLSSLKTISNYGCQNMFYGCTSLTSCNLPSIQSFDGGSCNSMFYGCTSLTSISLSAISCKGYSSLQSMFQGCTGLTNVDFSNFVVLSGNTVCRSMFQGCTNLASINMSYLAKLGPNSLQDMFKSCISLTELRFSNLPYTATNINSAFNNTLSGVTGCTVHFPAEWATPMASYSNITNGLGGTNTTVLFDLPNVTTLDLSNVTTVGYSNLYGFANNNYFANITGVNLSALTTVDTSGCREAFKGCTNLTSVNLSSLADIKGTGSSCSEMFSGCTGLTTIDLSSLKTISSSDNGCSQMFCACTGLTSVDLSCLTSVGTRGCADMFRECTSLTSVNLSSLENFGTMCCSQMFQGCTSLTTLSFPSITESSISVYMFSNMCSLIPNITLHFPSNTETKVKTMSGYSATAPFGATSGTVLFDLPATNTLTGADTVTYTRNPKYDTPTALAWKVGAYGTTNFTPAYYTSGTTDPTVGTTIYSDSACTTSVTTVDTIA